MSRTSFAALLLKYQSGDITPAEQLVVEQWYALLGEEQRELSAQEWMDLENRIWGKLQQESMDDDIATVPVKSVFGQKIGAWIAVAASVILTLGFGYYFAQTINGTNRVSEGDQQTLKRIENTGLTVVVVVLEDSSKVFLNPGAELRFSEHFTNLKREVFLNGEAFFEVSENPNRPFFVNAGQITTKVLGTSFRVKAPRRGSEVEVSVTTGKVSVYEKEKEAPVLSSKNGSGVILSANHQVTFLKRDKLFLTRLVENPIALPVKDKKVQYSFNYNDTALQKVLSELEETYSIDVEVERKTLGDCPLTANLSRKGLYQQLDLICAAIQGTYEVKGTTILISGHGCE
ncbi:FecR family protein [Dyadobacter sp. CY323]|uniref:FecR family protein n=1 Tax=Dyadobacter sp. CY323 TaxID=2907302 RepID=UPI001F40F6E5|nr:FecR family protein [Dyadobacter sp. CY323]MCE6989571.1 FecR domain-containing protein [Dyadobacter sp. CY323]